MHTEESSNWSAFMAGAFIGAGIALLLAPQSGTELRSTLRDYASKAKDELDEATEQGRAAWDHAVDRGQEYVEGGKQTLPGNSWMRPSRPPRKPWARRPPGARSIRTTWSERIRIYTWTKF